MILSLPSKNLALPRSLMTVVRQDSHTNDPNIDEDVIASFNQSKYPDLAECHCRSEFSREGHNDLRAQAEANLLHFASQYQGKSLRLAIVGSGLLLQTAIILAKLSNTTKFTEIHLDLIDPVMFFYEPHCTQAHNAARSLINLLGDLGFEINLLSAANKIFSASNELAAPTSTPTRNTKFQFNGKVNIEFYQPPLKAGERAYNKQPEIIFINDTPITKQELMLILDLAQPNASFISAIKQEQITLQVQQKNPHTKQWETITPIALNNKPRPGF
jgi:hypothetical protein